MASSIYCMMEMNSTDRDFEYSSIAVAFQSGLMMFIILSGLLGNALTLYALKINSVFHTKSYVFIANLAVADLLNCLLSMPVILVSSILNEWIFGEALCNVMGAITVLFCCTSLLTLCAISFERYLCITEPFKYEMKLTENRVKFAIFWTWFEAFIFAVLPNTGWSAYVYIPNEFICTVDWGNYKSYTITLFISCIGVPFFFMMYAYMNILNVARAQLRKVAAQDFAKPSTSKNKLRKETKAAFTLLIVIGTFLLCWIPHVIGMACLMFQNCPFPDWYFTTTTWLAMANSACNPIIYGILNKTFRTTCMSILRRRFQAKSQIFSMTAKPEISQARKSNIVHR